MKQADDHHRVGEVEGERLARRLERVRVVGEQHQRGEAGRADGIALGDRLGGVAHGVERIGNGAHRLGQAGHLGDAARVVGDRPAGVECDDDAGHREHRSGGDRDAVESGERVRGKIATQTASTGQAVDFIDTPRPAMMLVAWPVTLAAATCRTGLNWVPV